MRLGRHLSDAEVERFAREDPRIRRHLEVIQKKESAVSWCKHASDHATSNGGKTWKYLLIRHDIIAENITLKGLEAQSLVL